MDLVDLGSVGADDAGIANGHAQFPSAQKNVEMVM